MSISTRYSLRNATTTTSINYFNRTNQAIRRKPVKPVQTTTSTTTYSNPALAKAKEKPKYTRKKLKKLTINAASVPVAIKKTTARRMLSSVIDKGSNQPPQFNQVKNKFPNYRRKSSAIRIPSVAGPSQHHHNPHSSSFQMNQPPIQFNRQSSFSSVPTQPMSMPNSNMNNNNSPMNFSSFQFNPSAIAAAAVTLVQMIQNAAQNKDNQQTQPQQSQPQQQRMQQQQSALANRRNVNARYASSSSSFVNNSMSDMNNNNNNVSLYKNNSQFNKNYSNTSSFVQQQAGGPFSSNQHLSQLNNNLNKNQQQSQPMPYNHRYSTRFKYARSSIPSGKDKKTAPYNTTQYIMHDYFKRRAIDQECPNEQQQFSDDWNMALATNPSGSTSSSVINLELLKENASRSTLEDEQRPEHDMNLSITESENVADMMMNVDDNSSGAKLSSSI